MIDLTSFLSHKRTDWASGLLFVHVFSRESDSRGPLVVTKITNVGKNILNEKIYQQNLIRI